MAVFRLHRKEWERGLHGDAEVGRSEGRQRKRKREDGGEKEAGGDYPGGGRKGVSSGLSVVVKRRGAGNDKAMGSSKVKTQWWNEL